MESNKENWFNNEMYENEHPELKKDDGFTSPASSLPLYELKMLQEYIHGVNLQNLGSHLPHYKKNMMLLKFFKHKKISKLKSFQETEIKSFTRLGKLTLSEEILSC